MLRRLGPARGEIGGGCDVKGASLVVISRVLLSNRERLGATLLEVLLFFVLKFLSSLTLLRDPALVAL